MVDGSERKASHSVAPRVTFIETIMSTILMTILMTIMMKIMMTIAMTILMTIIIMWVMITWIKASSKNLDSIGIVPIHQGYLKS